MVSVAWALIKNDCKRNHFEICIPHPEIGTGNKADGTARKNQSAHSISKVVQIVNVIRIYDKICLKKAYIERQ